MGRETRRDGTDEEKSLAVNAGNTVWAIIPSRYPGKYTIDKLPPRYYGVQLGHLVAGPVRCSKSTLPTQACHPRPRPLPLPRAPVLLSHHSPIQYSVTVVAGRLAATVQQIRRPNALSRPAKTVDPEACRKRCAAAATPPQLPVALAGHSCIIAIRPI